MGSTEDFLGFMNGIGNGLLDLVFHIVHVHNWLAVTHGFMFIFEPLIHFLNKSI